MPASAERSRWRAPVLWVVACALPLLVWLLLPDHPRLAGIWHDDGVYLALGESLVDRGVYRDGHSPEPIQIAKYPPGVPLLASIGFAAGGDAGAVVTWLRACNLLFLAAGLLAFSALLRREGLDRLAPLLLFAVAWSPAVLDYLRLAMSEVPFLGVSLVTMAASARIGDSDERPWPDALWLGGLCIVALLLRTFGAAVFLAVVTHLLWIRRRSTAVRVVAVVLPLAVGLQLFLTAQARPAAGYEDVTVYGLPYTRLFAGGLAWVHRTLLTNSLQALHFGLRMIVPAVERLEPTTTVLRAVLWAGVAGIGALLVLGVRAQPAGGSDRSRMRPWHWLLLYSLALMLPWPAQVARFLVPLVPFLLVLVVRGASRLAGARGALAAAAVLFVTSVATSAVTRGVQTLGSFSVSGNQRDVRGLVELARRLDEVLPDGAVVASTMDLVLAHHGGAKGVWGWTITADRHVYADSPDVLSFNLGHDKWDWVSRELWAARLFHIEAISSGPEAAALERDAIRRYFGTADVCRLGAEREPLLQRLETDRASVRSQFRRLGVTHAVVLLREGNPLYDALLARLVRELASDGKAKPVAGLSDHDRQVWRIRW